MRRILFTSLTSFLLFASFCTKSQNGTPAGTTRMSLTNIDIEPLPVGVTGTIPTVVPAGPTAPGITKGIIAIHSIDIDQQNIIDSDIAVIGKCSGSSCIGNNAELTIDQKNQHAATNTIKADSIIIKQKAVVPSRLEANSYQVSPQATAPNQNPLGLLPELPIFLSGTPGTVNVGSTTPLAPGNYAKLKLGQNRSLVLTGGIYHFSDVDLGQKSSLTCAASCLILVSGKLDIGQKAIVKPVSGDPNDLVFHVKGGGHPNCPAARLEQKVESIANIYAANGLLDIGQHVETTGVLIGKWIKIAQKTHIVGGSAPNPQPPAPVVTNTAPAEGSTGIALNSQIVVTFSLPMNPATISASTTTTCSGSVQVSADGFGSCVPMTNSTAVMSGGDTVAMFIPAALAGGTKYKIRVTTAAQAANTASLAATFTQTTEWETVIVPSVTTVSIAGQYSSSPSITQHLGQPYIMYHSNPGAQIIVVGRVGNTWQQIGSSVNGFQPGGPGEILSLNGELYATWLSSTGSWPNTTALLYLSKWNGTSWEILSGAPFASFTEPALDQPCSFADRYISAVIHQGEIYLQYAYCTSNPNQQSLSGLGHIAVVKWNGTAFTQLGNDLIAVPSILGNHALVSHPDGLYAFLSISAYLHFSKWNGTSWSTVDPNSTVFGFGLTPHIYTRVTSDGTNFWIASVDQFQSAQKLRVKQFDGTQVLNEWTDIKLPTASNVYSTHVTLNTLNEPVVTSAQLDTSVGTLVVVLQTLHAGTWQTVTGGPVTNGPGSHVATTPSTKYFGSLAGIVYAEQDGVGGSVIKYQER